MSSVEIYCVKPGQAIKDGKLFYSSEIYSREDAQADATRRLKIDPSYAKLVYYRVNEDGSFKTLYSHTNDNIREAPKPIRVGQGGDVPLPKKKKPKKLTFTQKLMKGLGLK